ncbi:FAD-dependent monooxygenase [Streptomyces europaeiscabiei]|uniref:FAD-dependent monooxygenase n=1 Tax=Streptomyces europaeiscabiei TaxID=146819 RepID=UPI0029CA54E4|nr:FAD-dependent monooxygenase [Streptomyces europaeiscabiei]
MSTAGTLDTQVLVVGAGPVGLLLAGELRLGGADVVVLERRTGPLTESRASTLHARTMELLDQRGLLARLGTPPRGGPGHFGGLTLDLATPGPYAGQWKVPQARTEALLEEWARGLGARFVKGYRLTGLEEPDRHVEARAEPETPGGERLRIRAAYAVGCDGESSTVRELAGFILSGQDATRELLRADVEGIDIADRRFERHPGGLAIAHRGPDGVTRVMTHVYGAPARPRTRPPSFAEVTDAWQRVAGDDIGGGTPLWLNAFGDARRQAEQYRRGRVLLAGDAAHQQLPAGGQALNLGLQDAFNLGWKLAAVALGRAPESLLDTYHAERHPVGRRTLGNIATQAHLLLGGPEAEPLRVLFAELLRLPPARAHLAAMISGVDVRYPPDAEGCQHPLVGSRLPHLRFDTDAGPTDTFAVSRLGSGVLLDLADGSRPGRTATPWTDGRVRVVRGTAEPDAPFGVVLLRPDGHVAWADGTEGDLHTALRRWFGPPQWH